MNVLAYLIAGICAMAQLALPVRWAFLPLLVVGCHLGNVEMLPELTPSRLVIVVGLARALAGGFFVAPSLRVALDRWCMAFGAIAILSTVGHQPDQYIPSPLSARAGLVINVFGTYLYGRSYIPDLASFRRYARALLIVLTPLALSMSYEHKTRKNFYFALGAMNEMSGAREDKIRAKGPFRHSILGGLAGATALPLAYLAWREGRKKTAILGAANCLAITWASASSGPAATVGVSMAAVVLWRFRTKFVALVWAGVAVAILYTVMKGRGPWYLMASMDLVGGSTGWHRAKLIDQAFWDLSRWWLWGTDYTRHWMPTGVRWNPNMVDITNYYLHVGVTGGLGLTVCIFGFVASSCRALYTKLRVMHRAGDANEYVVYTAGACILAHALAFVSISYFDQMYVFFYLVVAAVPALIATVEVSPEGNIPQAEKIPSAVRMIPRYYS